MTVLHVKSPNGTVDEAMLLANNQTVTGIKTFTDRIAFIPRGEINPIGQIGIHHMGTESEGQTTPLKEVFITSYNIDYWVTGNGACISLRYADTTGTNKDEDGTFHVLATNGTDHSIIEGHPNGDLYWYGNRIDVPYYNYFVNQEDYHEGKTHGCVRWGYGMQMCWGFHRQTGVGGRVGEVTFPLPFAEVPRITGNEHEDVQWNGAFLVRSADTVGFTFLINDSGWGSSKNHVANWLAIGRWR